VEEPAWISRNKPPRFWVRKLGNGCALILTISAQHRADMAPTCDLYPNGLRLTGDGRPKFMSRVCLQRIYLLLEALRQWFAMVCNLLIRISSSFHWVVPIPSAHWPLFISTILTQRGLVMLALAGKWRSRKEG
jgi:hypothetical protein